MLFQNTLIPHHCSTFKWVFLIFVSDITTYLVAKPRPERAPEALISITQGQLHPLRPK